MVTVFFWGAIEMVLFDLKWFRGRVTSTQAYTLEIQLFCMKKAMNIFEVSKWFRYSDLICEKQLVQFKPANELNKAIEFAISIECRMRIVS